VRHVPALTWRMAINAQQYRTVIATIKSEIRAGNVYQINYTLPLYAEGADYGANICLDAAYGAWLEDEDFAIDSASPELFFHSRHGHILTRPMKGTAKRGIDMAADKAQQHYLRTAPKERAENLMIVDMLRNDLGRIALPGSVRVPHLFSLEKYPTLWQMTSTVTARTRAPVSAILRALFPCASITGAPKIQAMRLIQRLETQARHVYTGCIGYWLPTGEARFNVAIRTLLHLKKQARSVYGVGGGIVWDSDPAQEYQECQLKAQILTAPAPGSFALLETIRWQPQHGYCLGSAHLERMAQAAAYFDYPFNLSAAHACLTRTATALSLYPHKVRLLLHRNGEFYSEHSLLENNTPLNVAIATKPCATASPFVRHKTTLRAHYQAIKAQFPHHDDVILYNSDGLVTESCFANIVIYHHGQWCTPALSAGLLDGIYRRYLLQCGRIIETDIPLTLLRTCSAIYLINSVRQWRRVRTLQW
jgi:para-aminobenzoate synthetase / 4-amino-4-deoxychorismate lyase